MGLDMYAYVGVPEQKAAFWEGAIYDPETKEFGNVNVNGIARPRELAYWRKHGNLHRWMCNLWIARGLGGDPEEFNGVELELFWDDIHALETVILARQLPDTHGFFFGSGNTEHYRDNDLKFCLNAKAETFLGLRVFYNSSW